VKHLMTVLLCAGIAAVAVVPARAEVKAPVKLAGEADAVAAPPDTLELLARAVAKDSTRFDDLSQLGILYLERDQPEQAIAVLGKAHELKPRDRKVAVNLGAALDASNRPAQAQQYYREVLKEFPGDSVASCRLASSLYSEGKYGTAVKLLDEIIERNPRAHCAYFSMGVAFADAGIYKDAMRMWRKVVELAPASPEAISAKESIEVLEKFVGR
jgi:tetratricopeptide (TPR) repeat protein